MAGTPVTADSSSNAAIYVTADRSVIGDKSLTTAIFVAAGKSGATARSVTASYSYYYYLFK